MADTAKYLVRNTGGEPLINFSFMLRVEGLWDLPCKRIINMRRENEFDYIQEGGLNDYVHAKRKAISKPFTFQVERYVGIDQAIAMDPLALGTELVLPVILFVNKYGLWAAGEMTPVRTYVFTGCTVIAKDYGELNAEQSGLLVETTTISFRQMACVDIYSDIMTLDPWEFDGTKKAGKGKRRYNQAVSNTTEPTKDDFIEKAKKWSFDGTKKEGKGTKSAKYHETEDTEDKLDKKAKEWAFDQTKKAGKGTQSAKYNKEATEEQLDKKAKEWAMDGDKKAGTGTRSSKYDKEEVTKQEFEKKANLWPETASVKKPENKIPEPRLWPKKKSAQSVTTYLAARAAEAAQTNK